MVMKKHERFAPSTQEMTDLITLLITDTAMLIELMTSTDLGIRHSFLFLSYKSQWDEFKLYYQRSF